MAECRGPEAVMCSQPRAEQILTLSRRLLKALHGMPLAVLLSPATLTQCLQLWGKGVKDKYHSPFGTQGPEILDRDTVWSLLVLA